eukprot:scaffold22519_cov66-Phaeocystis_antarctica.AAC.2
MLAALASRAATGREVLPLYLLLLPPPSSRLTRHGPRLQTQSYMEQRSTCSMLEITPCPQITPHICPKVRCGTVHGGPLVLGIELYLSIEDARRVLLLLVVLSESARTFSDDHDSVQVQRRREENAGVAEDRADDCGVAINHA